MGAAYIPGLKVTPATVLQLERRLPLSGQVVVKQGERVTHDQVVARTELPGPVEMVNVANKLGLDPAEVPGSLLVGSGEKVQKGQPLARSRGFFGLFRSTLEAPISGTIESISAVTGQLVLRAAPNPVEVRAYVDGIIDEVIEGEGVVVRTYGAFIQGIFGIGGETSGELHLLGEGPAEPLSESALGEHLKGKLIVGGSLVTRAFLEGAARLGVRGVIVGGIDDQDLREFLGYDLGVAITGSEQKGLSLILTEGFGRIPMAERTYGLLKKLVGRRASMSGATQIRAGVIRPEVIVPALEGDWESTRAQLAEGALEVGQAVRIIREPHFGALAQVVELPVEAQLIPTEARVRVAVIRLETGERLTLPRANLELIEGSSTA